MGKFVPSWVQVGDLEEHFGFMLGGVLNPPWSQIERSWGHEVSKLDRGVQVSPKFLNLRILVASSRFWSPSGRSGSTP
eukprot:12419587-Karenia_brevis.AAC.1